MLYELTDLLTCPRCGPRWGLVLLVQEVDGRRVRGGWLGCPNCRQDYPVQDGVADLRLNSTKPEEAARARPLEEEELALKITALSGRAEEGGYLLLDGRLAHAAADVAEMSQELEVIAVHSTATSGEGRAGVSRLLADVHFPLAEYRIPAAAIAPGDDGELVSGAARCVAAGGRLVLFDATENDLRAVERAGLTLVASEGATAVAERGADSLVAP